MRIATLVILIFLAALPLSAQNPLGEFERAKPRESGIVESTGKDLVLIDVDARDAAGNPRRGLGSDDFQVFLNGREIEIETVDELCACGAPVDLRQFSFSGRKIARHYVLYFDFSQMDERGRQLAVDEAKRWARTIPQETNRVMVAAFSTATGIKQLTDFVEPSAAIGALNSLAKAKRFKDPWPLRRSVAADECEEESPICLQHAREDLGYTRRSLRALLFFLTTMEVERPSKTLLLFHQNLNTDPGKIYGPSRLEALLLKPTPLPGSEREIVKGFDYRVGDHWNLLSEIAGTAFLSRTTVFPIYAGGGHETWSVNFGANLASKTGGEYNRSISDLRDTMREAAERCPCTYRLGFRPDRLGAHLKSSVRVKLRGETILSMSGVRFPDSMDRWERRAEAVLANPEASNDLPLHASLVPRLNDDGKWGLDAIVSFDARVLEMLPEGKGVKGEWEVGALVVNHRSGKTWEMLGVSEVRSLVKPGEQAYIVHEQSFPDARPGDYEIRAFIRDKWANVFGGDRTVLSLPKPGPGATVAPLARVEAVEQVRTTLPMRKKKIQRSHRNEASNTTASMPIGDAALAPGAPVTVSSWACAKREAPPRVTDATLGGESKPRRLDPPEVRVSGACAEAVSTIGTAGLSPGVYEYAIRWDLGAGATSEETVSFRLSAPVESPGAP